MNPNEVECSGTEWPFQMKNDADAECGANCNSKQFEMSREEAEFE